MIVDYHTHSRLCKHADGEVEDYILRALELGLDEVGCSDHAPLPDDYDERHRMSPEQFRDRYAPEVTAIREKYADRIRVKRGAEVDYLPWASKWNTSFLAENQFDFVIGSIHFVGPLGAEKALFGPDYSGPELETLHEDYYATLAQMARTRMFDIVGHCDLIKKLGSVSTGRIDELIREAVQQIKASDVCVEINTSGLRRAEMEPYPGTRLLSLIRDLRIPLTLGSDAHTPGDVGMGFDLAVGLIEQYGRGKISVFDNRQRSEVQVSALRSSALGSSNHG